MTFVETWPVDGPQWDQDRWRTVGPTTIASQKGRIAATGGGRTRYVEPVENAEVLLTVDTPVVGPVLDVYLRGAGWTAGSVAPGNGYHAKMAWTAGTPNQYRLSLWRRTGAFSVQLGADVAVGAATSNKIRFRVDGTAIKARVWDSGLAEPAPWSIERTDLNISGKGTFSVQWDTSNVGNGYPANLDDLTITPLAATAPLPAVSHDLGWFFHGSGEQRRLDELAVWETRLARDMPYQLDFPARGTTWAGWLAGLEYSLDTWETAQATREAQGKARFKPIMSCWPYPDFPPQAWQESTPGAFKIVGNRAKRDVAAVPADWKWAVIDGRKVAGVTTTVTVRNPATGIAGIVVGYQDALNLYYLQISGGTAGNFWKSVGGTVSLVGGVSQTLVDGDTFGIRRVGTNGFDFLKNGVVVVTMTDGTSAFPTQTKVGLAGHSGGANAIAFDDFTVTGLGDGVGGTRETLSDSFNRADGALGSIETAGAETEIAWWLQQGAAGAYDANWDALAAAVVARGLQADVIFRPMWEMNGDFFEWWAGADLTAFIAYFRRIVDRLRLGGATGGIHWCPNFESSYIPDGLGGVKQVLPEDCYPGDTYVDYVGLDVYDYWYDQPGKTPEERWSRTRTMPGGLDWLAGFARSKVKPIILGEWGLWSPANDPNVQAGGGGGDNPYFIERMAEWIRAEHVEAACYFNVDGSNYTHMLEKLPLSYAVFVAEFAAGIKLRVELATDSTVPAWETAWTRVDKTNRVLALSSERGQREIFGPAEPGECFLTLDNAGGQLDPLNTSSPYSSLLTDDRLLRVSWVREDTGAPDTLFIGRVQEWPIRYGAGVLHHPVVLHVVEELARIGQTRLPHSLVVHELTKGTRYPRPISMWVMDEDVTAPDAMVADRIGGWSATPINSPQSAEVLPLGRGGFQATNNRRSGPHLEANVLALPAPPWSVMGVVRIDEGGNIDVLGDTGVPSNDLVLKVRTKGADTRQVEVGQVRSGGTTVTVEGALSVDEEGADSGEVCLIAMVDDTAQLAIYRVTAAITKLSTAAHGVLDATVGPLRMGRGMDAAYGLVCIWGRVVSLTHLEAMRNDVVRPWAGHTTDQRLAALLDLVAPDLPRTLEPSLALWSFTMLPARFDVPALDLFRRVVQSADGDAWVDRTGRVRFRERRRGFPAIATRTYGVGGVAVSSIEVASAGLGKVTECVATNEAGSRGTFRSTSATDHRLELVDMTLRDPVDLWLLAERTVYHRSNVPAHVSRFTLEPAFVGYDDALSLDIYDRADVGYERAWTPGTVTDELEVISVRHEASASSDGRRWLTTVATRPARRPRIRVRANGTTGEGAFTPGRTSIAPSLADLDIRAHVMGQDAADTMSGTLISRADGVGQSQFILALVDFGTGGRAVRFTWWSSSLTNVAITSPVILPSGSDFRRPVWVRVTLDVGTATVTFWRSDNAVDWQALHSSSQPGHESTVFSVSAVEIGASGSGGSPLQGFISEARIYADGVLTSHFDPSNHAPDLIGTTFGSDISGETWTVRANSFLSAW